MWVPAWIACRSGFTIRRRRSTRCGCWNAMFWLERAADFCIEYGLCCVNRGEVGKRPFAGSQSDERSVEYGGTRVYNRPLLTQNRGLVDGTSVGLRLTVR